MTRRLRGEVEPAFRRVVFAIADTTAEGRLVAAFGRELAGAG